MIGECERDVSQRDGIVRNVSVAEILFYIPTRYSFCKPHRRAFADNSVGRHLIKRHLISHCVITHCIFL